MATKEYSPDTVAQSFIKQYYDVLANKPHDLFRFYKEDSSFSFCEGSMPTDVAVGSRAINERVGQVNFAGTRVDLSEGSIDAQKSGANCILIVVTGEFTLAGKASRLFVQTFFLAGQGTSFYCCNSVLRLLPAPLAVVAPTFIVQPTPAVVAPQPAPVPAPAAVVPQPVHVPAPKPVVALPAAMPVVAASVPHVIEHEQDAQQNTQATEEEVLEVVQEEEEEEDEEVVKVEDEPVLVEEPMDTGPKSYLDMLKRGTKAVAAPASKAKAQATASSAAANKHAPVTTAAHSSGDKKASGDEQHITNSGAAKSKPVAIAAAIAKPSLYISKLPLDATQDEVRSLFIKFGDTIVKSVEIAVGKGLAFVEVESDAVLKTILADVSSSLYTIKGAEVSVEERKPSRKATTGGRDSRGPSAGGRTGASRRDNKPSGASGDTIGSAASGGRGGSGGFRPVRTGDKPTTSARTTTA